MVFVSLLPHRTQPGDEPRELFWLLHVVILPTSTAAAAEGGASVWLGTGRPETTVPRFKDIG